MHCKFVVIANASTVLQYEAGSSTDTLSHQWARTENVRVSSSEGMENV